MKVSLELRAGSGTKAGFIIPDAVVEALGGGRRPAVKVTVNGYTYRSSIANMGGTFMLGASNEVRRESGAVPGNTYEVNLELDTETREVAVPEDLAAALAADPDAAAAWARLSYSHHRAHVEPILAAKAPETRARRIEKTMAILRESKT